ncbi:hypothetical protein Tco_1027090 [Tanacetum coccineum]
MAQQQQAADVHPDELCPPNKRYDLMDANKKVDLENVQCPSESKILMNIITNHPLRFSIAASASVPWIYMAQFWHTLKEDGSKHRLKFLLDRKELTLTLDDFRTIFHLPQANDNNHASFVPPPSFSDMVPFYKQVLGFTMELKTVSNFKIPGLLQPWQTLCKIFSKCLTTRAFTIRFIILPLRSHTHDLQLIVGHYMTAFPEISRRARDKYHNLEDDEMIKSIFNSGKNKAGVGMKIPSWMITDEMKLTEHYKMYDVVFGLDVPTTQPQSIESTQGMHSTTSIPSHDELQAKQNVQKVEDHLITEEIKKLVEGAENVENVKVDSSTLRQNDNQNGPGTRLEPKSNKESPEVEITAEVQLVDTIEEEEESAEDDYELKSREKGKNVKETRHTPSPITIRSHRTHSTLISSDTEKL